LRSQQAALFYDGEAGIQPADLRRAGLETRLYCFADPVPGDVDNPIILSAISKKCRAIASYSIAAATVFDWAVSMHERS
jgi:hypothetical protein